MANTSNVPAGGGQFNTIAQMNATEGGVKKEGNTTPLKTLPAVG